MWQRVMRQWSGKMGKIKDRKDVRQTVRREVKAVRRLGERLRGRRRAVAAWMAVIVLTYGLGLFSGCAAATGAARGLWEGARLDLQAAREVARPGSADLTSPEGRTE